MRIKLMSLLVEDQETALQFYTEVLGFRKQMDFPVGAYRWITVSAGDGPEDVQLSLEPNANPAAKTYQMEMFAQGVPLAAFEVDDVAAEHARLEAAGVNFTCQPADVGAVKIAVFSDGCGNLIQLYEKKPEE